MNHHPRQRRESGFTLLEIVLAVALLSLVITVVYSTWNAALKAWKRGADVSETFQRQRIVLDTLSELAKSLTFFNSAESLYAITGDHGENGNDSITFVTASDVQLPQGESMAAGMRRVTILLDHDEYGRPFLGLVNAPALEERPDTPPVAHILSADVSGFFVRYRSPLNNAWQDDWHQGNLVPTAIEFTLVFGGRDGRNPPVVVTRAVEVPVAEFALQSAGHPLNQESTTNEVKRRDDIDVDALTKDQPAAVAGEAQ